MNRVMSRRIAALERAPVGAASGCVFASEEDARAAGVRGGWLCIGPTMAPDEWAAAAKVQQAALCEASHGNA